ncbi:MAG: DUF805 domain-containing protein [Deferribacteraceae bacterium]|nr:DUF805 domain-containing protein [Deferribacteraceae bacterium]
MVIKCGSCGENISDGAAKCPACGASQSKVAQITKSPAAQNIIWMITSREGRIGRKSYWIQCLITAVASIPLSMVTIFIDRSGTLTSLALMLLSLTTIMPMIKRLHDRNRSAWFMLVYMIPIVNLWIAIEVGFLRGTRGDNRYGSDPLAV